MAGFTDLLGSLIQNGLSQSGSTRITNALGEGGSGAINDILGNLGSVLGGSTSSSPTQAGGGLGDLLSSALGGLGGSNSALGGLGALGGALLGGGKGSAKGALGGGALAMLASIAFSALKNAGQAPSQAPSAFLDSGTPEQHQVLEDDANIIVKAMINAAKADGAIDTTELNRIIGKFEEDGLTNEEKDFFMTESSKPLDLEGVIRSASGRPEVGAQLYAASLLAIEVDTQKEQQYLQALASGLGLNNAAVDYIERSLSK